MPVAIPTWRNVLLAPDAMPLRWGWTTETAPEANTGLTTPTPKPQTRKPGRSTVHVEVGWVVPMRRSPPVTNSIPMPKRRREWIRTVRRPAKKEVKKIRSVIGRKRTPAASGP